MNKYLLIAIVLVSCKDSTNNKHWNNFTTLYGLESAISSQSKALITLLIFALFALNSFGQAQLEMNVIYGDRHIFTISTPEGWVNDKEAAARIGLVSFFYNKEDIDKNPKSHMYAMGYDKDEKNKDLKSFVNGDIANFKKRYPNLTYEQIETGKSGAIIDTQMLSSSNLEDRYKEEVVYLETEFSILVFVFSTFSEQDYLNYQPVFDQFMGSFNYRGNNPGPFLEWQKQKRKLSKCLTQSGICQQYI